MRTNGIRFFHLHLLLPITAIFISQRSSAQKENYYEKLPFVNTVSRQSGYSSASRDENAQLTIIPASFGKGINTGNESAVIFRPTSFTYPINARSETGIDYFPQDLLLLYARSLRKYAKQHQFDTSYVFLTNMGMLSNRNRFFVVNLRTMRVEFSGMVSHGRGEGATIYTKQYSNQRGSKCTSLGRYAITGKYTGEYGNSYRVYGLDSSNSNAFERRIVLHYMDCIPDIEGAKPACVSDGCPAVSRQFFTSLQQIIDSRKRPILLWIFDSNLEEATEVSND